VGGGDSVTEAIRRTAGLATPMTLRVAVTLGLPDRLRDADGGTAEQLAVELNQSPVALDLLLNHLTTLGVVERTSTGYRTTGYGANLCADAGNGLSNLLHLNSAAGRAELALVELGHSIATGQAAYPHRYGRDFWADAAENPQLRETFDRQMTERIREQLPQIVAGCDWARFTSILDVGGGQGTVLAAILRAHPGMRGHLVDLEPTAVDARRTFSAAGVADRVQVTAGSFFDPLPAGADGYLLVDILHDWDDEHAHRILARCVQAAHPASRILVVEPVGGMRGSSEMDLVMLALYGGRERRLDEFRALAEPHRLVLDSVVALSDERCLLDFRLAAG